jgi:lysozyme family protein
MSLTQLSDYTKANIILDKAVNVEGSQYTDIPGDAGGPTRYGVTLNTATAYASYLQSQYSWDGTMQNFSQDMAVYVYDQEFWQKMHLDGIFAVAPLVADQLFGTGINAGGTVPEKFLQRSLNVLNVGQSYYPNLLVDGNAGQVTANALQTYLSKRGAEGMKDVLFMLCALQSVDYITIAEGNAVDEKFEEGWQNRARGQYDIYASILN